jgi:uncharacterized cupredoxin-like copper-binding protein
MTETRSPDGVSTPETSGPGAAPQTPLPAVGMVATLVMAGVALALGDLEAGAVAGAFALGAASVWRGWHRLGAVVLALVSAVTLVFMLAAAVTNARTGTGLDATAVSAGLAAIALATLSLSVVELAPRRESRTAATRAVLVASAAVFVALMGWRLMSPSAHASEADLALVAENLAFSATDLAVSAGSVTVSLANEDLFWHTFTIDELGVDLRVPVGADLSTSFEADPGVYEFYCGIPGHPEAGMVGTLEVEG